MHPEPLNSAGNAEVDPTGDARVDAAIAGLAALGDTELADRPAVLEAVHDRLREILGELGDAGRPANSGQGRDPGHGAAPHAPGAGASGADALGAGASGAGASGAGASGAGASGAGAGDGASGAGAAGDGDPRP